MQTDYQTHWVCIRIKKNVTIDIDDDSEGSQDDEDVSYETTPLAAIYALLEKHLQIDDSQGEDAWFAGGLMERLTKHMDRNDYVNAAHAVSEHTCTANDTVLPQNSWTRERLFGRRGARRIPP